MTPEIYLSMMTEFVVAPPSLFHRHRHCHNIKFTPNSAIMVTLPLNAQSNNTSSFSLLLNMATLSKPMTQNRAGKYDRQIALMAFLQKVMFDEEHDNLRVLNS